ncbi:MAG: Mur ligase family protein, partial [Candidatus Aminicenantes bacterium]|nr:Mur ligase family protein [Candidatus Aminicenantes bacterium]
MGLILIYLWLERLGLERDRRRVPRRVCVTGSRGKSSVTRLIAAALREDGEVVLAKTTGSKPVLILPDGTEREIRRAGAPSLLEQKHLLRLASRLGARTLVAEMMSIRPESLEVESRRIFKAGLVAVTNVRLDHLDLMGSTRAAVASSLAAAFPEAGEVLFPAEER